MQSRFTFLEKLVLLVILSTCQSVLAQTTSDPDTPILKPFGSSLKQLKWDPNKKVAVETTSQSDLQKSAAGEDVVRIDIDLVVCDVLVRDQDGKIVMGLNQDDFTVSEDEKPQRVVHFSTGDDLNIERSIVLVIDY